MLDRFWHVAASSLPGVMARKLREAGKPSLRVAQGSQDREFSALRHFSRNFLLLRIICAATPVSRLMSG